MDNSILEFIMSSFNENLANAKLTLVDVKPTYYDDIILLCHVDRGIVQVGDWIRIKVGGKVACTFQIKNVYMNNQQVFLGVSDENIEIIIQDEDRHCYNLLKNQLTNVEIIESIDHNIVTTLAVGQLLEQNSDLSYLGFAIQEILQEDSIIDQAKTMGLKLLKTGAKTLGIAALLGIFLTALYNKLEKQCLTKMGLEKIKCKKQVFDKIVQELTRQQQQCLSLADPKKKASCLKYVEKKKAEYIKKATDLNEIIAKRS